MFFYRVDIIPEKEQDEAEVEDSAELLLEKVEEEFATVYSDDDDGEETLLNLDDLSHLAIHKVGDDQSHRKQNERRLDRTWCCFRVLATIKYISCRFKNLSCVIKRFGSFAKKKVGISKQTNKI